MEKADAKELLPSFQLPPLSNPFVLRIGSVGTGFGIGCGVGIGHGRPINFGAVPGADGIAAGIGQLSGALRPVAQHVNKLAGKVGWKHVTAGMGCGIGFGYGFGAGLMLKPGVGEAMMEAVQANMALAKEKLAAHLGTSAATTSITGTAPGTDSTAAVTAQPAGGDVVQAAATTRQGQSAAHTALNDRGTAPRGMSSNGSRVAVNSAVTASPAAAVSRSAGGEGVQPAVGTGISGAAAHGPKRPSPDIGKLEEAASDRLVRLNGYNSGGVEAPADSRPGELGSSSQLASRVVNGTVVGMSGGSDVAGMRPRLPPQVGRLVADDQAALGAVAEVAGDVVLSSVEWEREQMDKQVLLALVYQQNMISSLQGQLDLVARGGMQAPRSTSTEADQRHMSLGYAARPCTECGKGGKTPGRSRGRMCFECRRRERPGR